LVEVDGTKVSDLAPLVANERFRNGDSVDARDAALDAGDCADILALRERKAVVTTALECE